VLIAVDQLGNALAAGDPDETIRRFFPASMPALFFVALWIGSIDPAQVPVHCPV